MESPVRPEEVVVRARRTPSVTQDKLIAIEWKMLRNLRKMLKDSALSVEEKTRVANAVAYHASVLNKLLKDKGEQSQFSEETLGDFVRDVDVEARTAVRRDFAVWTRKLSARR
jgi:hypothetical protein